jgi:hypothetical protein
MPSLVLVLEDSVSETFTDIERPTVRSSENIDVMGFATGQECSAAITVANEQLS